MLFTVHFLLEVAYIGQTSLVFLLLFQLLLLIDLLTYRALHFRGLTFYSYLPFFSAHMQDFMVTFVYCDCSSLVVRYMNISVYGQCFTYILKLFRVLGHLL